MPPLRIYSDTSFGESAERHLRMGAAPHEIIVPEQTVSSVLARGEANSALSGVDIAFGQPDVASVLDSKSLRWVHLTSAGFTRYDTPSFRAAAAERSLVVTNSSSVYARPCAEHVVAFMLGQARQLPRALGARCASGTPEWNRLRSSSRSLRGDSVVILGFGSIAAILVELLRPFGLNVIAMRRRPRGNEGVSLISLDALPQALASADHLVSILPESAETTHFVSRELLAQLKRGAVFYNIGRGATVDQAALTDALSAGQLRAAWLDVTDPEPLPDGHPLLAAPNCFITPHTAGGHLNESESLVRHFLENLRLFLDGAPLRDRIM